MRYCSYCGGGYIIYICHDCKAYYELCNCESRDVCEDCLEEQEYENLLEQEYEDN